MPYTPFNWYWFVDGRKDRVFSSATRDYVLVTNATYLAWRAADSGNVPTEIGTELLLGQELALYSIRPTPVGMLDGYLDRQISAIDLIQFRILLNLENRVRALESKVPITAAQYRAGIKAVLTANGS